MQLLTDKEYFAYPAISKSQLHQYDPLNPIAFWRWCKLNPQCTPDKETDAMVNGKLRHMLLLEPQKFEQEFLVIEGGYGYGTRNTKAFQKVIEDNPTKTVITQEMLETAKLQIDTLKSYPLIQSVLEGATVEKAFLWTDEETGLPLKCKLDLIKNIADGLVITEYKGASNMDNITKGIDIPGRQWEAGMQTKAIKAKYGVTPFKMLFIVQSTIVGEEHKILPISIDSETCEFCEDFVNIALGKIATRIEKYKAGDPNAWRSELVEQTFMGTNGTCFSYGFDRLFEAIKG